MQEEQSLQVARCTKIIEASQPQQPTGLQNADTKSKYVINIKQIAKFVVGLGERLSPTDIEEGMRVGVDRHKYEIQLPLPPRIDPSVTMMTVEEKPDVTYSDVGGCKEQIEKLREVVELPLLSQKDLSNWVLIHPKVYCCMVLQVLGKHCVQEQLLTEQTPHLFESLGRN